jgi:DNA-binding phage protein
MLMTKKPRVVAMGEVRAEYPGSTAPLLTLEQHNKIAELAKRTGFSEEEICRRLIGAAQPSFDKVIDAALRLMALQADSLEDTSH